MAQVNLSDLRQMPIPEVDFSTGSSGNITDVISQYEDLLDGENVDPQEIMDLIITSNDEDIHNFLSLLSDHLTPIKRQRQSLNLDFIDYISQTSDFAGPKLGNLYQPPAGLSDSIFTSTTKEFEGLRFGSLRVDKSSDQIIVYGTARFKPSNEDDYETDHWGFTEIAEQPLMRFQALDERQSMLIRAFVPCVFRDSLDGFMKEARKSITLIDRLADIQLPSINEVENDLNRYEQQRERANGLDRSIRATTELIDSITYSLYELTDDEIEQIEDVIVDD